MHKYSVKLEKIIEEFQLKVLCCEDQVKNIEIETKDINRPGLELAGYTNHFSNDRIQLIGMVEYSYLKDLSLQTRKKKLDKLFSEGFPCLIVARGLEVFSEMIQIAKKYNIPVMSHHEVTTELFSSLNRYLSVQLAPRQTLHAGLVEVYGEGVLIMGESGVGKSETALELVKRGHRLVADDVVEVRRVSNKTLVGSAPETIRHLIEIRGLGFIDIRRLYGIGSVKITENIKLVVKLENWQKGKEYDRVGITDQYTNILGIEVPSLTIPVRPGRNLAVIVEVAAMNNRQKDFGYNAAKELESRAFGNPDENLGSVRKIDPWK
ncbi:MAG: HPr(Ser) kinase/phosphatase [Clostridiaceae bacterium]|nr:HPr(Ser) kinase/phosphatase [Clostridiaceae bacterium]